MSLGLTITAGCATQPPGPRAPTEVVRAQIDALERGDEARAASWLTADAQARAPLWPPLSSLPAATSVAEVGRSAVWRGPQGDDAAIVVVRGPRGWQITEGVLGLSHADSPERALDTFGRALVARDWTMVLELLPSDMKAAWSTDRLAQELSRGWRAARWKQLGEALVAARYTMQERTADRARASVKLDSGAVTEVAVMREGAGWKVFDVTPRSEYIAP